MNDDDELTDEERATLAALPRHTVPPARLEESVVRSLRARGVLSHATPWRLPVLAAAALALFALGLAAGRVTGRDGRAAPAARSEAPRFVILVFGDAGAVTGADEAALVAEYGAWARSVPRPGTIHLGDKLAPEARLLDGAGGAIAERDLGAESPGELGGLFVVEAKGWDEALAVARTCPHLKHGGRLVVRRVET